MSRHHDRIKNDPRWKAARLAVLERDDHTCTCPGCPACGEGCASTEQLEVDHIIELAEVIDSAPDLAYAEDNLTTLCRPCHARKRDRVTSITRTTWVHRNWPELADLLIGRAVL